NTPAEIVEMINMETNRALADPKIKAQLAALGNTVLPGSPADFGRLIAKETDKWAKVIKFANIKPEEAVDTPLDRRSCDHGICPSRLPASYPRGRYVCVSLIRGTSPRLSHASGHHHRSVCGRRAR